MDSSSDGPFAMTILTLLLGLVLVAFGVVYWHRPTVFRRGMWMQTSISIRVLSVENHERYVRGLGALLVAVGIGVVGLGLARGLRNFGFGGQPLHDPRLTFEQASHIEVIIDPNAVIPTRAGTAYVLAGQNEGTPAPDWSTHVSAERVASGSIAVRFQRRSEDGYAYTTHLTLTDTTGAPVAKAATQRGAPCRGLVRMNRGSLQDLADAPLVVEAELISFQAGSDVTDRFAFEISEADLR